VANSQLTVTDEEQQFLQGLLEMTLKETRVEEHRTRAPGYRQYVIQKEGLITSLLKKLEKAVP
jgi:hypothetical protein